MTTTPQIGFFVQRHFLKDLSFENPTGPVPTDEAEALKVNVTGNVLSRPRRESDVRVVETTLTIDGRDKDRSRFICELTYVAEVQLSNIPEPVEEQTLCVDVPNYLITHINNVIDHAGRAGGLPGLRVERINFLALYQSARAKRAAASH